MKTLRYYVFKYVVFRNGESLGRLPAIVTGLRMSSAQKIDYRLAFDLAPIGMVLSRNRTMVDCNQRVCEMFGVPREQLIGQTLLKLL